MPFWMKYGLDREHGGVYTCVNRDGSLMDTTKSVWFQGRFGFIAAYAYNNIEKNPQWLAASKSCIDFIEAHCFDTDGRMFFEVTAAGIPVRKRRYVFSETFAENSREIIEKQVVKIRDEVFSDKNISLNNKNKEIIFRLSNCGIFNLKDSVVLVAEQLGISKNTVYLHLRNCL